MSIPMLIYTIAEVCRILRSGRTAVYQAIQLGELRAVKHGRRTKVLDVDLRRYLEGLPPLLPAVT
jgi:excisionase family DNA binding protein